MDAIAGVKIKAVPKPPAIEKERMKCQSSVKLQSARGSLYLPVEIHLLVLSAIPSVPPIKHSDPRNTSTRGPFASKSGPI